MDIFGDSAQNNDSHHELRVARPIPSRSSTPTNQAPAPKMPRKPFKMDQVAKAVHDVVGGILEEGQEKMDKIEEKRLELKELREIRFCEERLEFQKLMFTTLAALVPSVWYEHGHATRIFMCSWHVSFLTASREQTQT